MRNRIIRDEKNTRIPIIGRIKVGEKIKRDGKEFPVSNDYFSADGNYKHIFDKKFSKTNKLEIVFISDDLSECFVERMEIRTGPKLYAKGDGEFFEVWDKAAQRYILRNKLDEPNLIQEIEQECQSKFEDILTLYFLVIGINEVFGVWKFSTKGKDSSIPSILKSFDLVLEAAGRIKSIPFTLSVEKVKSQKPESKNLFPVVSLVANIGQEYMQKLQDHMGVDMDISGIITENKIDSAVKQVSYIQDDFPCCPEVHIIKDNISNCTTLQELRDIGMDIHKQNLDKEQTEELKKVYKNRQSELEVPLNGQ